MAVSSSCTILMTCWPAFRLSRTSAPTARARTRATKSLTTRKLTSASSSASRTSRIAASTSASVTLPRPLSLLSASRSRSESWSNTAGEFTAEARVRAVIDDRANESLWANPAFRRVWTAETISIFGSFITRMALPLVAILALGADALGVALIRSMDLVAGLVIGLAAGAWVDRLRRRPVLIWTDLGRAALLATIPLSWVMGWLSFAQLLLVALMAAALTSFSYAADRAYLP